MDKSDRTSIRTGKAYKFTLINEDVLKGTVERRITGYGIIIKTFLPGGGHPTRWEEIKSAEPLESNPPNRSMEKKELTEERKDALKKAKEIRISTQGDCIITGKPGRFYNEYFYLKHPIYECTIVRMEDIRKAEIRQDDGSWLEV